MTDEPESLESVRQEIASLLEARLIAELSDGDNARLSDLLDREKGLLRRR
jgi:hypothetical protein